MDMRTQIDYGIIKVDEETTRALNALGLICTEQLIQQSHKIAFNEWISKENIKDMIG